jgi:hypothetical protein
MRIESDEPGEPSLPDILCSSSSTRLSSFVMMFLSSSTTELSVGAIADVECREGSMDELYNTFGGPSYCEGNENVQMDAQRRFCVR